MDALPTNEVSFPSHIDNVLKQNSYTVCYSQTELCEKAFTFMDHGSDKANLFAQDKSPDLSVFSPLLKDQLGHSLPVVNRSGLSIVRNRGTVILEIVLNENKLRKFTMLN